MKLNDNEYSKVTGPEFWKKNLGLKKHLLKKALKRPMIFFFIFGMILEPIEGLKLGQVAYFQKCLFFGGKRSKVNFGPFWTWFCFYFAWCYFTISYQISVYLLPFVFWFLGASGCLWVCPKYKNGSFLANICTLWKFIGLYKIFHGFEVQIIVGKG